MNEYKFVWRRVGYSKDHSKLVKQPQPMPEVHFIERVLFNSLEKKLISWLYDIEKEIETPDLFELYENVLNLGLKININSTEILTEEETNVLVDKYHNIVYIKISAHRLHLNTNKIS